MRTLSFVVSTLLVSVVIGSAASAAHAARPAEGVYERSVSFADLDLSRETDAKTLYRRIATAAADVCETPGVLSIAMGPRMRRCAHEATARAVADVNAPALTRYHATRCL